MSNKEPLSRMTTRSCTKREEKKDSAEVEKVGLDVSAKSALSFPSSDRRSNKSKSSSRRNREVADVMNELIKIQEEETAITIARAEANAEAKREEARVKEEAKRKELELKKRLMEERLSLINSRSSSRGSSTSRRSLVSIDQPIPTKEAVTFWMQGIENEMIPDDQAQNYNTVRVRDEPADGHLDDQPKPRANKSVSTSKIPNTNAQDEQFKPWANKPLLEELTDKLSTNMKLNWGMYVMSQQSEVRKPIGLDSFSVWLSSVAEAATVCTSTSVSFAGNINKGSGRYESGQKNVVLMHEDREKRLRKRLCLCCKKDSHSLEDCKYFQKNDVQSRWELVKNNKVCFNCLKIGHRATQCRKKGVCGLNGCVYHHHNLLHNNIKQDKKNEVMDVIEAPTIAGSNKEHIGYQDESLDRVLLRVIPLKLIGSKGNEVNTFALIDDGSTISVIEKSLADELNLDGPTIPVSFSWTDGSTCTENLSKTVSVKIVNDEGEQFVLGNVKTLKDLQLPVQSMNMKKVKSKWPHLQQISEKAFHRGRPRLLIGHEHIHYTVPSKVVIGPGNAPIGLKSKLGWTINGPTGKEQYHSRINQEYVMFKSDMKIEMEEMNSMIKKSFEQDFIDYPSNNISKSEEEVRSEVIMKSTCSQTEDGRWEIGLLWREENPQLPESRSVAWRRLNTVEKKLKDNIIMKRLYDDQMENYAQKGYSRKLSVEEVQLKNDKTWYLPHFSVDNPRKPNKFRFVFYAASRSHGQSLNSYLLPGPNLFNNLTEILFKFRKHKIAIAADIEEMFLRIKVRREDQDALRFLWRGEESGRVEDWCMASLIFGAACSPTCAIYVLQTNAEKNGDSHQEAVQAIKEQFYMDDYLDSMESVDEAKSLTKEVVSICNKGGFNLRNFISNSQEFMNALPKESWSKNYLNDNLKLSDENNVERVLGLYWNFHEDSFNFKTDFVRVDKDVVSLLRLPTKREVLQAVMSVYDPLGFITPITMKGKILMQELWKVNVQWDEKIPVTLNNLWLSWIEDVLNAERLKIPRCYGLTGGESVQLHVFCDASKQDYCAVAYLRIEKQDLVNVAFVFAKSRVAPIRETTIPRLELQAAVLGSRIANLILQAH
ncbi:uncharacterized protein LOC128988686 [Macrosteles quadrilineatus]|uniref:uncharacterized protein LOC128988686 n=1 Tax=Macrosteles quadrilineatus TaxID=74068 RepID=UPI0023E1AC83|nr:uncharacterized protein LOC128988686 [Macrosteles quadrilineatus]